MSMQEKAVRSAAAALHGAIAEARQAGLAVVWPSTVDGLTSIAISETKRAAVSSKPIAKAASPKPTDKP